MKTVSTLSLAGSLALSLQALASGSAFADDAVMAPEPEPVEYVRICDAYGAGFFYIPGTETCMQIGGEVRYQIGATNDDGLATQTPNYNGFANGWDKGVLARINFDVRSETDWGTLQSYIRFEADWNGVGDGPVAADQAWISLGGLRMGYTESAWVETAVGDVSNGGSHSDNSMSYGDQQRALIQYSFSSNGLYGVLSLEDDALAGEGYMPDVVAVAGYESGWGGVWARAAYDEAFDGFAASAGVQVNVPNMEGSSFRLIGYYADGDHFYGVLHGPAATVFGGNGNSEWSVLASYYHQFTSTFGGSIGFQYFNDFYLGGTSTSSGINGYSAELSLVWVPVENFEVRSEFMYDEIDTLDGTVSGYLRFTRFF